MSATPVPATFLNIDLEVDGPESLSSLARQLTPAVVVLHCGPTDGGEHLCVEPVVEGMFCSDPARCADHLLELLEALPEELKALWDRTSSRVFDYGFDAGREQGPSSFDVPSQQLARMSALGIAIRITVYPFRGFRARPDQS